MAPVNESPPKRESPQKRIMSFISNRLKRKKPGCLSNKTKDSKESLDNSRVVKSESLKEDAVECNGKDGGSLQEKDKTGISEDPCSSKTVAEDHSYGATRNVKKLTIDFNHKEEESKDSISIYQNEPVSHIIYLDSPPECSAFIDFMNELDQIEEAADKVECLIDCIESHELVKVETSVPRIITTSPGGTSRVISFDEEDEDGLGNDGSEGVPELLPLKEEGFDLPDIFVTSPFGFGISQPEIFDPSSTCKPKQKIPKIVLTDPDGKLHHVVFVDEHNELLISKIPDATKCPTPPNYLPGKSGVAYIELKVSEDLPAGNEDKKSEPETDSDDDSNYNEDDKTVPLYTPPAAVKNVTIVKSGGDKNALEPNAEYRDEAVFIRPLANLNKLLPSVPYCRPIGPKDIKCKRGPLIELVPVKLNYPTLKSNKANGKKVENVGVVAEVSPEKSKNESSEDDHVCFEKLLDDLNAKHSLAIERFVEKWLPFPWIKFAAETLARQKENINPFAFTYQRFATIGDDSVIMELEAINGKVEVSQIEKFKDVQRSVINVGSSSRLGLYEKGYILKRVLPEGKEYWTDCHFNDSLCKDLQSSLLGDDASNFQDFGEAVEYIFYRGNFFERLCNLVRYDVYKILQDNSVQMSLMTEEQIISRIKRFCTTPLYQKQVMGFVGQTTKNALLKVVEWIEGPLSQQSKDYEEEYARRHDTVQDFLVAFTFWVQLVMAQNIKDGPVVKNSLRSYLFTLDNYCAASYLGGMEATARADFHRAVMEFQHAMFASMVRKKAKYVTQNILGDHCCFRSIPLRLVSETDVWDYAELVDKQNGVELVRGEFEHELIYLEIAIRMTTSYYLMKMYKKCAVMAKNLLKWMREFGYTDGSCYEKGYYALTYPWKYKELLEVYCDAEKNLGNYSKVLRTCNEAIDGLLKLKRIFTLSPALFYFRERQHTSRMNSLDDDSKFERVCYEEMEFFHDLQIEEAAARIIVNPSQSSKSTHRANAIYCNNLGDAIAISKAGDLIFLYEGIHDLARPNQRPKNKLKDTVIKKGVKIVGVHPTRTIVRAGAVTKESNTTIIFKRLSLVIGKPHTDFSFKLKDGHVRFEDCYIRSCGQTAFNVHSAKDENPSLTFRKCVCLAEEEETKMFLNFIGERVDLTMENSYISNFQNAITCPVILDKKEGCLEIYNTIFAEVQSAVKLVINHRSTLETRVEGCHFRLTYFFPPDSTSLGIAQTGGEVYVSNNYFYMQSHSSLERAISLHSLNYFVVSMNLIHSVKEGTRKDFVCKGICISECVSGLIECNTVEGMQIGIKITNNVKEEVDIIYVENNLLKANAVGIQFDQFKFQPPDVESRAKSPDSPEVSPPAPSRKHRSRKFEVSDSNLNILMKMNYILLNQYGLVNYYPLTIAELEEDVFENNAKSVILCNERLGFHVKFKQTKYIYSGKYKDWIDWSLKKGNPSHFRKQMMKALERDVNTPLRIRYNKPNFYVLNFKEDEDHYTRKYSLPLIMNLNHEPSRVRKDPIPPPQYEKLVKQKGLS